MMPLQYNIIFKQKLPYNKDFHFKLQVQHCVCLIDFFLFKSPQNFALTPIGERYYEQHIWVNKKAVFWLPDKN